MNLPDLLVFFDSWTRTGNGQFKATCPMPNHNDSDPSVALTQDFATGNILMQCFGCGSKAPELVQALGLRLSDLFGDPGHPSAVRQEPAQEKPSPEELEKMVNYTSQARELLFLANDYILERYGLSEEEGYSLGLGVDPGDDTLNRPEGYESFNSGTPHLIIPFTNPDQSEILGMQGRRLIPGDPRWRSKSGSGWSKIGCFGWNHEGPVVITEGPSDGLSVVGRAKLPSIAVRGANVPNEEVCRQIKDFLGDRKAVVVGDNDLAGEKFARTISEGVGIPFWKLPEGQDDLANYLAGEGTLDEILAIANSASEQPAISEEDYAADLKNRIIDDLGNIVPNQELLREAASFPHIARLLRQIETEAPYGRRGTIRAQVTVYERELRTVPVGPPGGGANNNHGVQGGQPLPNQTVIIWNPEDQLHVTEFSVKSAMDQYNGGEFYQAAPGQYVKIVEEDLVNLKDAGLKSMLSQIGHWRVINGQQERGHVPHEAAKMVSDPSWECKIPVIKRRVEVPFMLEDGTIVSEKGYHEDSGIFLLPRSSDRISVPEVPAIVTDADVVEAKRIFEDVVEGFMFSDNASKTNLIAMTLTSPLRELFKASPMVPLLTSTAPQSGSGKGTSVRVPLSTVGIGPYSLSTTTYNSDENEFEKKLVGKLLKKTTYIFLDNIRTQVNSSVMEQMLTAANYDGRTLGYSEVNSLSTLVLWVCTLQSTGSFNRDLTRRCVPVELRKNYKASWKHKNIEAYLADMRGQLIWACFVVARKWLQDGGNISNVRLDGYGGWTEVIGGILESVLGYEDFLGNLESFRRQQDEVAMTIDGMLERWLEANGEKELNSRYAVEDFDDPALHQLLGLHNNPPARVIMHALDRQLTSQRGHIIKNTHMWEPQGQKPIDGQMKHMFKCVPLPLED